MKKKLTAFVLAIAAVTLAAFTLPGIAQENTDKPPSASPPPAQTEDINTTETQRRALELLRSLQGSPTGEPAVEETAPEPVVAETVPLPLQQDTPDPVEETVPATPATETVETVGVEESVDPVEGVETVETVETVEGVETVETVETTDPADTAETVAALEALQPAETIEVTETLEGDLVVHAAENQEGEPLPELVPLIVIDDVPLTDAIRNLARQSGLNFQFDPRISSTNTPNISIRFENVTPQEALEAVLENHNMQLVKEGRQRIGRITMKDPAALEPLISQIIQLKYSDPTNLTTIVKSTLSPRSQVVADPRTSQLIVTTTELEMESVTNLIASLDLPTRQVLIESKIVETAHAPNTVKGINWSGTFENQRFELGNNAFLGPAPFGSVLGDPKVVLNTEEGFDPNIAFLNADGVSAVFSFFNNDNDSEVLSTPRAVTLDNQMALLSVTRAFPIFTVTPGSANSPAGAEITYTNLGTILQVTPRIAADDNISLRVIPEVSNIDGRDIQVLNGEENTANIYAIRRMEANVMIPSGNTLVMGGLVSDSLTKTHTKVPILGDTPGLGWLFRSKGKARNKANLIIFVTPTIVETDDFYADAGGRDWLKTRYTPKEDTMESSWDSAKPHDWTKPKTK